MEKVLTVDEIYQCLGMLSGLSRPNEKGENTTVLLGFVNEKGISEGMRRIANKTLKKLKENYPEQQFKDIQSLSFQDIYEKDSFPKEYQENDEDKAKLAALKQSKIKEVVEDKVTIVFEELPDFKILDSRLEERKENLS